MYLFFIRRLDSIILMLANPLLGPLEGEGGDPKNLYFFGPKMALASLTANSGPKKDLTFRTPTPSNVFCNGCCPHQNHYIYKQQVHE